MPQPVVLEDGRSAFSVPHTAGEKRLTLQEERVLLRG